jgi:hypothetical protein
MLNLFEMLEAAQGGQAMDNLARQFGLSMGETRAAVEALLPAFAMGLKRQADDPATMPNLFALMSGPYRQAFETSIAAFNQQATQQGNEVLATLFGSKEASRAIADQAAAWSGVASQMLQAMLPVLAGILMGGLTRAASSEPKLQDIFARTMQTAMPDWTGGDAPDSPLRGRPSAMPRVEPNPNGGGFLGALLGSLLQQGAQQATPAPASSSRASVEEGDILGQMFETGRQMQEAQVEALQSIFDTYLGKKKG